jgi:hypothetical protein
MSRISLNEIATPRRLCAAESLAPGLQPVGRRRGGTTPRLY